MASQAISQEDTLHVSLSRQLDQRSQSQWWRAATQLLRNPIAVMGIGIILSWVIVAITVDHWAIYKPLEQNLASRLAPPSLEHPFGTDYLGRDVFTRVLYGSRISLPLVLIVAGASLIVGGVVGAVAGFAGGLLEDALMRAVDITLAFPAIVLAMAIISALGPGLRNAMLAMLAVGWPRYARLMRGQVLAVKQNEHVLAARCLGVPRWRIVVSHIVPLCISPMVVLVTLDLGIVLLLAAGLSFIGLGAVPPQPEWGVMIAEGRTKFTQWWIGTFPGLAIMSLVLGFNFVGDSLRDALDPRMRNR